ncbi:RtcB family protein [Breznakiella homolactica]|uniref:3'-phosphate/5'-hydroxy nucleic acid ligase n=1 Tax=Breznakiella homolactica TaxID=2798577 RepID=A0A7T8BBJ9_9SPIR|nr:RtcB family protein [Breznakiella homolactica]QQO10130.1 RtcB family protein [Breznakiella homolactica]
MAEPLRIRGLHNEALVFARAVEMKCEDQILQYLNHEAFADTTVRIMPDVHAGKGAVVGFTATSNEFAVPSLVGADIGCGVCAYKLGRIQLRAEKLDAFIRRHIPSGTGIRPAMHGRVEDAWNCLPSPAPFSFGEFKGSLREICKTLDLSLPRVFCSLGTLGGGNHFIEIDRDDRRDYWLLIHSGSRGFGLRTAKYHEAAAAEKTGPDSPIKYLTDEAREAYIQDTRTAQEFARLNRTLMALLIIEGFFRKPMDEIECIESIHNYIDFSDGIVRKGAIAARKDQPVVIPFSMADGAVLGTGRGNADWNCSAPHGAGRKMSRSQARGGLSMDEYRKRMRGIWTSCVSEKTLDESPMAYKKTGDVLAFLGETVDVSRRLLPEYNFKAAE